MYSIWKAFAKKMQGLYKMQGLSMVSGDVDATLLSELFKFEEGTACFGFIQ